MTKLNIRGYAHYLIGAGFILATSACANRSVKMVQPHTGTTAECSGSGYGVGTSFSEGFIDGCMRAYGNRGFVRVEELTPEQRAGLERRGLLPKE